MVTLGPWYPIPIHSNTNEDGSVAGPSKSLKVGHGPTVDDRYLVFFFRATNGSTPGSLLDPQGTGSKCIGDEHQGKHPW